MVVIELWVPGERGYELGLLQAEAVSQQDMQDMWTPGGRT